MFRGCSFLLSLRFLKKYLWGNMPIHKHNIAFKSKATKFVKIWFLKTRGKKWLLKCIFRNWKCFPIFLNFTEVCYSVTRKLCVLVFPKEIPVKHFNLNLHYTWDLIFSQFFILLFWNQSTGLKQKTKTITLFESHKFLMVIETNIECFFQWIFLPSVISK